ncbi:hypothetical protein CSB45_07210 [candidate division KSB3 bacterium]|uniref:Uncharacterized protein n=1 Tax=candidate division KSB3 bacterium TaxID=2044937 RepID=A0A2G6E6B0_9BACT|nr:MAG: hypothetical protein CSB45_07210 [candidate division KSB3 bacterium]PIE29982.1 MAG: hypothetical protein CSA57_05385 [candidate division KSB3 bacterium]
MFTEIVKPSGTRQETFYVLLTILFVALGFSLMVIHRSRSEETAQLESYQLSAFSDLNDAEKGIFSDLYAAAIEIDAIHDLENIWPQIDELEEIYLAPFLKDAGWERRGKLAWSVKHDDQATLHTAAYLGISAEPDVSASFLLLLSHHHDEKAAAHDENSLPADGHEEEHSTIWYAAGRDPVLPNELNEEGLIAKGWKEVIAYKGEEEVRRLKGEAIR